MSVEITNFKEVKTVIKQKPPKNYEEWIKYNEPSMGEMLEQKKFIFNKTPKISIIVPVYNISPNILKETLFSVVMQTYQNWELCVADASDEKLTINLISNTEKVKVKYIENKNIADNTNEALSLATGDYIVFLDHDDILAPFALFELVKSINENKDVDFIYSDEDKLVNQKVYTSPTEYHERAFRLNPHFKPDWSPDTLRSYNYICHLICIKKTLLDEIGYMNNEYNGSQDYDLTLRATEKAKNIVHISKILYHWRMVEGSTALKTESKMYAFVSAKKAIKEHIKRIGLSGDVQDGLFLSSYKIYYNIKDKPLVSIIIPNHNNSFILKKCISSILKLTRYQNYEIIIIENNSTEKELFDYYETLKKNPKIKIIEWNIKPFNYSKINNFGVERSSGEYILLLNNDITIINGDWLDRMVEYIIREDVGIVGAKLYYPNDTIQHAGVVLGMGKEGMPGHIDCKRNRADLGYMGRLKIVQNLSCVTGACLLTKRKVFEEVGGLEEKLVLAFNDVDYCYKVYDRGYRIVWTPYAELYHHESATRGYEDTPEKQLRFWGEFIYLRDTWQHLIKQGDRLYPKEGWTLRG